MLLTMFSRARAAACLCVLAGGLLVSLRSAPVSGQPADQGSAAPVRVMTDTMEYCLHLADLVGTMTRAATTRPPAEVGDLSLEGQRMCDEGQVRGGIMRLRRAVAIMRHQPDAR